ncbi:MAG: EAL domain-containing protein [Candidatus Limnocylindria bacterium]
MSGRPLRVLLAEHSADDAQVTLLALRDGGYLPTHERVETATSFREAIERGSWDVVISDHNMPAFSSSAALAILRESDADMPFFIVSGRIGEDAVMTAMRSGAHDYVPKDSVGRLGAAVARELVARDARLEGRASAAALRRSEARLLEAQRLAQIGNWEWHVPPGRLLWSAELFRIHGVEGHPQPDHAGFLRSVHSEDREFVRAEMDAAFLGHRDFSLEHRLVRPDGTVRVVQMRGRMLVDATGDSIGMLGTSQDITERSEAEFAGRRQADLNDALLRAQDDIGEAITISDGLGIQYANDSALVLSGYTADELQAMPSPFALVLPELRGALEIRVEDSLRSGRRGDARTIETVIARKDGHHLEVEFAVRPFGGTPGTQVLTVGRDISERRRVQDQLRHLALYDALTDLPNRTLFRDRAGQALHAAAREGSALALLMLDLDRFKEINDAFGHQAGDDLLRCVAVRLKEAVRETDTVARLGGDEFAVLLPGCDPADALGTARKIAEAFLPHFMVAGHAIDVRASLGAAMYPLHGNHEDKLLRHADIAMYVAKRGGLGVAVYEASHEQDVAQRLTLGAELREAIDTDQLLVYYQPTVHLRTGQVWGIEALVRWQHPAHGLLMPQQFLDVAVQVGLIGALTTRVLRTALADRRLWAATDDVPVAVNVHALVAQDRLLPELLRKTLGDEGAVASFLELEITEDIAMVDQRRVRAVLDQVRDMGIRMSMDDYGTGHCSLAQLRDLPIGTIKIDRSFITNMAHDEDSVVIARSTIDLGHNLGLTVVAEGIEDEQTLDRLVELGCDIGQGYALGRPMPIAELLVWLQGARAARQWPSASLVRWAGGGDRAAPLRSAAEPGAGVEPAT